MMGTPDFSHSSISTQDSDNQTPTLIRPCAKRWPLQPCSVLDQHTPTRDRFLLPSCTLRCRFHLEGDYSRYDEESSTQPL